MGGGAGCEQPIFIVGTERSGSNLLRLMLGAHPEVVVPHPPHVLQLLGDLEFAWGDPADPKVLRQLARAVAALVDHHIHPWAFTPDVDRLVAEARPKDLLGLMAALYDQACEQAGRPRWGNKSTFMVHHLDRIESRFPAAGLIWLYRDPRDVALSSRDSVFNPCHPARVAALWRTQQELALDFERRHPGRLVRLAYEDLVADPAQHLQRVCAAIQLPFDPAMLKPHETEEARHIARLSESWANADRGILNRAERWRRELGPQALAQVEAVAADTMRTLGYTPAIGTPAPSRVLDGIRVPIGEAWGQARVEWRSLRKDKNHFRRWKRRAFLLRLRAFGPAALGGDRG